MTRSEPIVLCPYDPDWTRVFEHQAAAIRGVLGGALLEIHHIGSTAVAGMLAKPVVDMLGVVEDVGELDAYRAGLDAIGYVWLGENRIPGRRYFDKHSDDVPMELAHLHVFARGDPRIAEHLAFRDYLRTHPEVAAEYAELKRSLHERFAHDRRRYTEEKDAFIRSVIRMATAEGGE